MRPDRHFRPCDEQLITPDGVVDAMLGRLRQYLAQVVQEAGRSVAKLVICFKSG